jgi:hypothetical protein
MADVITKNVPFKFIAFRRGTPFVSCVGAASSKVKDRAAA